MSDDWQVVDTDSDADDWTDVSSADVKENHFNERLKREAEKVRELKKKQVSGADAFVRGKAEGASFGFVDNLAGGLEAAGSLVGLRGVGEKPINEWRFATEKDRRQSLLDIYEEAKQAKRDEYQLAEEARPGSFLAGNIAGGVATGGAGVRAAKAMGGGIKGALGAGALEGGIQGVGSGNSEGLAGMASDFASGAKYGVAVPAALKGGGLALKGGKKVAEESLRFIPGTAGAHDWVNRGTAKLAKVVPGQSAKEEDLYEFLSQPELRRKLEGQDIIGEIDRLEPRLAKQIGEMDEAVGKRYGELQEEWASGASDKDIEKFLSGVEDFRQIAREVSSKGTFYQANTKNTIGNVQRILSGNGPGMKKNPANTPMRERLLEARRYMQGVLRNKDFSSLPKTDQNALGQTNLWLQKYLHNDLQGSDKLLRADKLYKIYKDKKAAALRPIKGKETLISRPKLDSMTRSQTLKGRDFQSGLDDFESFFKKNPEFKKVPEVTEAVETMKDLRKSIDLNSLANSLKLAGGGPTSQAVNALMQASAAGATGGLSLLGMPVTNPYAWAKIVDGLSSIKASSIAAGGPKAKGLLGKKALVDFVKNVEKAAPGFARAMAAKETRERR